MKKSIILTAILVRTVSLSNVAFGADEKAKPAPTTSAPASTATEAPTVPPPPPPPPPPVEITKNTAANKATAIVNLANTVIKKYDLFVSAETIALQSQQQKDIDAAYTAVQNLATSIDNLMRNTKSLESDIKKLIKDEGASLGQQETLVQGQKKLSPVRKQAEVDLIKELQEKFKQRISEDSTSGDTGDTSSQ